MRTSGSVAMSGALRGMQGARAAEEGGQPGEAGTEAGSGSGSGQEATVSHLTQLLEQVSGAPGETWWPGPQPAR